MEKNTLKKDKNTTMENIIKRLKDIGVDPDKITIEAATEDKETVELSLKSVIEDLVSASTDTCDRKEPECEDCEDNEICKAIEALRAAGFDDGRIAEMLGIEPDEQSNDDGCTDCDSNNKYNTYYVPLRWVSIGFAKVKASSFKHACDIVDETCIITDNTSDTKPIPDSLQADRNPIIAKLAEIGKLPIVPIEQYE